MPINQFHIVILMTAKKFPLVATIILSVLLIPQATGVAYAVYLGNPGQDGTTGVGTLEEAIDLARQKVVIAKEQPAAGSGTPFLAADGVLGASAISAGVFGGIAVAFIVKGRHGRYALPGAG